MNKYLKILTILLLFFTIKVNAQNNIRLEKEVFKGNDFSQIIEYRYTNDGRIARIILSQDGKLHSTTTDFIFNSDGLLTSYLNTFNLKISPQKTTITYDNKKRISSFEVKKTQNNTVVKSRAYSYNGDTVKVIEPINLSQTVFYIFNSDSNIIKIESVNNPSSAFTNLYNRYDNSKNPHTLLGGFVDEKPVSKNNSFEDNYVDIYKITRRFEYEKKFASNYKSGGAKIPTQIINGLPLKAIETSFDKAYNKVMPVSTTTYQYIKL
jgi:hypothetical protein